MRTSLLLAVAAVFTASLVGCSDADTASTSMGRRTSSKSPPAAGTPDDHSSSPSDGENAVDTGNPNANTNPEAPATTGTASSEFAVAVTNNTPSMGLGEDLEIDVSITPKGAFNGPVDLTVTGLPPGVTAAPATATVAGAATTAKVKLTTSLSAVPSASGTMSPISIVGKNGAVTATANVNLKIAPKLKLTIPTNIDALRAANVQYRDEWGSAFGATQQALKTQQGNGIVVTVFNADSKKHIIHGQNGFAHGSTTAGQEIQPNAFEMQNGAPRTRTLNPGTNANGYPHDGNNGVGASFRISVQTAN